MVIDRTVTLVQTILTMNENQTLRAEATTPHRPQGLGLQARASGIATGRCLAAGPGRRRDRLRAATSAGFTMIELMVVVLVMMLLTTAAVPSYVKYLRRTRTIEATMNLRRLFDASVSYFQAEHARVDGVIVSRQFPVSSPTNPVSPSVCCVHGKCDPRTYAASWNEPGWSALNFSVDDPFLFAYQYDAGGFDAAASFTATAFGDLNCDGRTSLFQRVGRVGANNAVLGAAGLYVLNEIE